MPFIQAMTYSLSSRRGAGGPTVLNVVRVVPTPFVGAGNGIDFVMLIYNSGPMIPVGTGPAATPRRVFGYFPAEEFENHRMVLQSEAPVEIEWSTDPVNPGELVQLVLRTGEEPPGEGPTDTS